MAQHDMNIANQGFPSFRSDLNAALLALVTQSSGSSVPVTPTQYQLWLDTSTTPLTLKFFDGSDWIVLSVIDVGANTALPVIANDGLSGNALHGGVYSDFSSLGIDDNASATHLTLSDSETVVNESGAAHDFRIEGDTDTSLLITKASSDRIGVGVSSPSEKLHVNGTVMANSFVSNRITLANNAATSINLNANCAGWCFISSFSGLIAKGGFYFKVGSSAALDASMVLGTPGVFSIGILSGATGISGDFTISAHTDNKLYFENRTGATLTFTITLIAAHV